VKGRAQLLLIEKGIVFPCFYHNRENNTCLFDKIAHFTYKGVKEFSRLAESSTDLDNPNFMGGKRAKKVDPIVCRFDAKEANNVVNTHSFPQRISSTVSMAA